MIRRKRRWHNRHLQQQSEVEGTRRQYPVECSLSGQRKKQLLQFLKIILCGRMLGVLQMVLECLRDDGEPRPIERPRDSCQIVYGNAALLSVLNGADDGVQLTPGPLESVQH